MLYPNYVYDVTDLLPEDICFLSCFWWAVECVTSTESPSCKQWCTCARWLLGSGYGLWAWNGAKPIRPCVDQACDLDLISTVLCPARLNGPRWLSLIQHFGYKSLEHIQCNPHFWTEHFLCLALKWMTCKRAWCFSSFLWLEKNGEFCSGLLEIQYLFWVGPSSIMRVAVKCHILTLLALESLTSHCGRNKVLPRGH